MRMEGKVPRGMGNPDERVTVNERIRVFPRGRGLHLDSKGG